MHDFSVVATGATITQAGRPVDLAVLARNIKAARNAAVLEKAGSLGEHNLSGAVVNPRAFQELFDAADGELTRGLVNRGAWLQVNARSLCPGAGARGNDSRVR